MRKKGEVITSVCAELHDSFTPRLFEQLTSAPALFNWRENTIVRIAPDSKFKINHFLECWSQFQHFNRRKGVYMNRSQEFGGEKKRHDYFSRGKTLFCRVVPSEHCQDVPVNLKVMTEVICNETNVENSALKPSIM